MTVEHPFEVTTPGSEPEHTSGMPRHPRIRRLDQHALEDLLRDRVVAFMLAKDLVATAAALDALTPVQREWDRRQARLGVVTGCTCADCFARFAEA